MADSDHERTLQRYKLLEEVGQGGMAVVYKGFDTTLNREVAVKVLHPHLAGVPESRARLQREAHAVAKLRHENILEIFDYSGPDSPESYIVTEFIHGKTLKNFLTDNPLPFAELAEMIASEVARALEHAHALGVIHRDIKPENVMIRDDGLVKLMDFGIAQIVDKERMTVTGQLLGSPAYMAPEHVEGKPLDFRTDVFAVGILLYQLATGQLPFRGKNPHEVLKRIAECKYVAPELVNPMIGARLGRVIARALQREPGNRFPDVAPMRKELLDDLADAGVEDPRKELGAYFVDPKGWPKTFKPRLVSALAEHGQQLAKKGRMAAALELWSRALAVDPKSSELRALVDGMARRRRVGQAALWLGGALAVAGGVTWGGMKWQQHEVEKAAIAHDAVKPPSGVKLPPSEKPPEPKLPVVAAIHPKPHVALSHVPKTVAEIAPVTTRTITVDAEPQGDLKIALDDGKWEEFDPSRGYPLDDKPHVFHLKSAYVVSEDVQVAPGEVDKKKVRLRWKAAKLTIHATPENADVMIENKPPAHSGDGVDLFFKTEGRRDVAVKVSAPGYRSATLSVPVRAGDVLDKKVELDKAGNE